MQLLDYTLCLGDTSHHGQAFEAHKYLIIVTQTALVWYNTGHIAHQKFIFNCVMAETSPALGATWHNDITRTAAVPVTSFCLVQVMNEAGTSQYASGAAFGVQQGHALALMRSQRPAAYSKSATWSVVSAGNTALSHNSMGLRCLTSKCT